MDSTKAESLPVNQTKGTLGTLFLVGRKTGLNVQGFPIDSERVTIGRDYDCDIRLYFSDVSKLHAEIVFDLLSGQAQLRVHGGNGVHYSAVDKSPVILKPPAVVPLSDKDSFIIRKKVFRFEYPVPESPSSSASQATTKSSIPFPSPAPAVRRRASHRLSLVPLGKQFMPRSPAKANRRNTLGAAIKGGINNLPASEPTQQAVEEEGEDVVDMVDGEEGDKVYLETTEPAPAVTSSTTSGDPFVTLQTEAKSILLSSTTSPRARKSISFGTPIPEPAKEVSTPARPAGPSRSQSAPSLAMPEVTPQLVRLTPKGSPSLRKSLLLRSARKAWEETRSPGVQGAVDQGKVAIRSKSAGASPKAPSPEKSTSQGSARAVSLGQEISAQQERQPLQEIQWIAEDGKGDVSVSDSDSDLDTLEADVSLDLLKPGQSVFSIHHDDSPKLPDESFEEEEEPVEDVEGRDYHDENDENMDMSVEEEEPVEEYFGARAPNQPGIEAQMDMESQEEEEEVEEVEDNVPDMAFALPGTPAATRALSQFYTPQPRRGFGRSQKPLATTGGPASRFLQSSAASDPSIVPGSLGKPQRILATVAAVEPVPATPVQQQTGARGPMSERRIRQSLATPRALPAPPMSFKNPVREAPSLSKPSHPALNITLAPPTDTNDMPSTPIGELRRKLGVLRQQGMASASKLERQGLSSSTSMLLTPAARPTLATSISFTAVKPQPGPSTFRLTLPRTPVAEPASGSDVPSLETSPNASGSTLSGAGIIPMLFGKEDGNEDIGNDSGEVEDEDEGMSRSRSTSPSIPPSLSFTGLKEMLRPLAPPKTPNFTGMRELFAPSNRDQATPAYSGVKEMMKVPAVAPTPSFVGVKEMMRSKAVPPTPAFDGIEEMLAEPELEAFEGEESMEEGFEAPTTVQSTKSRASTRGRKPATSRSTRATRSASADVEASSKPSRSRKPAKQAPMMGTENGDVLDLETGMDAGAPPSPAKSTRSTKSRSSARSAKSETSKSARSTKGGARRKIETDSGTTVEIIKSSPPRPALPMPDSSSPTKSKPSKSSRTTRKEPLMDVDEQTVEEVPSKSARARKGKATGTPPDPESSRSTASKSTSGKKVTMAVEDKENEEEHDALQVKAEKTKLRKARQSTVASRTRSRT